MNILCITGTGMGGTEKAAYLFAECLALRGHTVVMHAEPDHWLAEALNKAGGTVICLSNITENYIHLVHKHQIDVIHQHVSGYSDQRELYRALDQLGDKRPRLIQTNVFGRLMEHHDHNHVDMRMFVSLTIGMQAFQRPRLLDGPPVSTKHTVLFNPLSPAETMEAEVDRAAFRAAHGIAEDDFLVVRVGRTGLKWARWECEAFQLARRKNPRLRMLMMEPSADIASDIASGRYGPDIRVEAERQDSGYLINLYHSADLMLHASKYGESYGYTLAEGMVAKLPIITLATPWGDNAQTELVRHGCNGYVCGSIRGMAAALLELSHNPERCRLMGLAGRERILRMSTLASETDFLEEVLTFVTGGAQGPLMRKRFEEWTDYIRRYPDEVIPGRYELDHGMWIAHVQARACEIYRGARTLKRFLKQRMMSHKVRFPTRWAS